MAQRNGQKILIVKLSAVGDVVHALPALNALRLHFPDAHIGWVAHPGPCNLLEGHPQLDELIALPRKSGPGQDRGAAIRQLKSTRWDVAIDFQGLTKSGVVAWMSRAPQRIGFRGAASREINTLFMTTRVRPTSTAVIQMNLELLQPLGIHDVPARAVLHWTDQDAQRVDDWARANGLQHGEALIIDPFAGWESKLWSEQNWMEVAHEVHRRWNVRPIVFHGPGEEQHAEELARKIVAAGTPALVAPKTTLREYSALAARYGGLIVAGDTGPMHIAAAAGVPTVALFGPSDSRRNAPTFEGARFEVLQDFTQPCATTFARHCKHHAPGQCMSTLTPDIVLAAAAKLKGE